MVAGMSGMFREADPVNHPSHYCNRSMEAIDIIEMIIEVEKNPKVGKDVEDLKKAQWYLNRMIQKVEEENEG